MTTEVRAGYGMVIHIHPVFIKSIHTKYIRAGWIIISIKTKLNWR